MKVCDTCNSIFDDDGVVADTRCPIRGCDGDILNIDENFYEIFKILNDKGYVTNYCCSGHSFKDHTGAYISFFEKYDFACLPKDFEIKSYDMNSEHTIMRKDFDSKLSSIELQKQIWETAKDALEWAEHLAHNYN